MPSRKIKLWNENILKQASSIQGGASSLYCGEAFFWFHLEQTIRSHCSSRFVKIEGSLFTPRYIEENIFSLGLFSEPEIFFVTDSDKVPTESIDFLQSQEIPADKGILFSFGKKTGGYKKINKWLEEQLEVDSFKFWEVDELLDFYSSFLRIKISAKIKTLMTQFVQNTPEQLYTELNKLVVYADEQGLVSYEDAYEVLQPSADDPFYFSALLSKRKFAEFYKALSELIINKSEKEAISLVNFLKSHLIKVYDPSFLDQKPKLSRYDKEVQLTAQKWRQPEVIKLLFELSEVEISLKKRSKKIVDILRMKYLKLS